MAQLTQSKSQNQTLIDRVRPLLQQALELKRSNQSMEVRENFLKELNNLEVVLTALHEMKVI